MLDTRLASVVLTVGTVVTLVHPDGSEGKAPLLDVELFCRTRSPAAKPDKVKFLGVFDAGPLESAFLALNADESASELRYTKTNCVASFPKLNVPTTDFDPAPGEANNCANAQVSSLDVPATVSVGLAPSIVKLILAVPPAVYRACIATIAPHPEGTVQVVLNEVPVGENSSNPKIDKAMSVSLEDHINPVVRRLPD